MIVRTLLGRLNPQQLISLAWRVRPNSEFLVCEDRRLSRGQVLAAVQGLARGLATLGIRPGDRVATLLPACPEAVYAGFLPWVLGNVEVPLNPLLRERELRHILADCGARAILTTESWCGQNYLQMLARLRADLPDLSHIVVREAGVGDGRAVLSLPEVMARGGARRHRGISGRDLGRIAYTSGTTGWPKGVAHSREAYWRLAHPSVGPRLDLSLLRCLLLPFPPYHFAGWLGLGAAFLAGGKVVLLERFHPERMLECIEREEVTQVGASPTMYRLLLDAPGQGRYDLSSLRRVTVGAEPFAPDLAQALHERLGCHIESFYGMTECGMISWTDPGDPWQVAATTVGRPVPGARLRIVDDERRPVPPGERGEVAVQTTQMMLGYYRDPDLSAQALDGEGWLYTGDVGYLGEDGCLRLIDRKKDLVIRGGQNVYPTEIEGLLASHPAVRQAAAVGIPGGVGGEALWAFLELAPGAALTRHEVLDYCRGRLAPYKIPDEVRFVERLPATSTGKVQKFKLREMALAEGQHAGDRTPLA